MPRLNVIVLDRTPDDVHVALWADVPVSRQTFYANAAAKSVWTGATPADNTNLQNGSVVEQVTTQRIVQGTTIPQMEVILQGVWQSYQNDITNNNPWSHYGSTWDGTTWTVVTVS